MRTSNTKLEHVRERSWSLILPIEIIPENDPSNVLEIVWQNDPWSDLGIDLGNALHNASMHSRDCTSIP